MFGGFCPRGIVVRDIIKREILIEINTDDNRLQNVEQQIKWMILHDVIIDDSGYDTNYRKISKSLVLMALYK